MTPTARAFIADEWPQLVRKAMELLFRTQRYLQSADSSTPGSPEFICGFEGKTREWGVCRAHDLQVSLINEQRQFVYHDWHEMIGSRAYYPVQDGSDMYDDVFSYPFGAVAWIDNTSNVLEGLAATRSFRRFNLALFSQEAHLRQRIVVEAHQEIP